MDITVLASGARAPLVSPEEPGDPAVRARIHTEETSFDGTDAELLRTIDATGSLHAAAAELGRSYSRAHRRLDRLETAFGDLVERRRGGADGGGSQLTPSARDLLARFDRLIAAVSGHAHADETVFEGTVQERDGDLATVATDAGRFQALVPATADAVALGVRADAVTLQAAAAAPDAETTSARNRVHGTVTDVDAGHGIALVEVDVGAARPLTALVTQTSVATLDLEPGTHVLASFKATATRGIPHHE